MSRGHSVDKQKRKKKTAESVAAADVAEFDRHSSHLLKRLGGQGTTAIAVVEEVAAADSGVGSQLMLSLRRVQFMLLEEYRRKLHTRSTLLSAGQCWDFFQRHAAEAERFGVAAEFRAITATAARRFKGEPTESRPLRDRLGVAEDYQLD